MKRKISVLVLMWASMLVFLPAGSRAAETNNNAVNASAEYNMFFQEDRRGRRGRGRGWDDNNRRRNRSRSSWRNRRSRVVTRTFWRNGRRYTRVVRIY